MLQLHVLRTKSPWNVSERSGFLQAVRSFGNLFHPVQIAMISDTVRLYEIPGRH